MNFKKTLFLVLISFALILAIGAVSAIDALNDTLTQDFTIRNEISLKEDIDYSNEIISQDENIPDNDLMESETEEIMSDNSDDVIVVNNWDELQYYCSQTDKDYTLKLKENTNFYPSDTNNANQQIKIKNNVKIIGSNGSWIGDSSSDARMIHYVAIIVEDNQKSAFTFENVTFNWIGSIYSPQSMDGIFIQMGSYKKFTNVFKNCQFSNIRVKSGHATVVYLKKGSAIFDNCSFINCTSNYGVLSVYDPNSVKTTDMIVRNCYFENNYAETEPGCINNCGKLTVYNTTFIKNRSFWWAGAIHTHFYGNTTIYDSNFTDNVAGWNGGALYTYSYLQIYNTIFSGNNCTTNNGGGAIGACAYQSNPHIYIEGCLFENNANNCWGLDELSTTGTGRGGAISIMDEGSIEVRDTTFIANAASIGTAICAWAMEGYGSPSIIISNNSFINHTREGDTLNIRYNGIPAIVENNYFEGNSIVFSNLTLTKLSEGREQATFKIDASLKNPTYYDEDILDKTLYDVYVNNKYVKTVSTTTFTIDFGDLDICDVYVIPTISNRKSNSVTATSTREYIFVSKSNGNDENNGISRDSPVNTLERALELATVRKNIILLDGDYSEDVQIGYDVTIKGESNSTLTENAHFTVDSNEFTLKNLKINNVKNVFINQNSGNLLISNCIITNNQGLLISNNANVIIMNSILLNNSGIIEGSGNYVLDYNWWGSTLENPGKPLDLNINNWIVLTLKTSNNLLEDGQSTVVNVDFCLNNQTRYNTLPEIEFNVNTVNGTSVSSTKAASNIVYTLSELANGSLTVSYNDIGSKVDFIFIKSNPNISIKTEDIMVGDDLTVRVRLPSDAGGNITVTINDIPQTKVIESATTSFTFTDLNAGNYTVNVSYSGDRKYESQNEDAEITISKYDSSTEVTFGEIEVSQDLNINILVSDGATGNITLYINDMPKTLTLNSSKANYTIKNIQRGDYIIKAVYNGDDRYLKSEYVTRIEVGNVNASMTVEANNITYGQTAIIKIRLNDDATGEVFVTIDDITNSSIVSNGIAEVYLNGLNAGINKNITVFYTGDDTYYNMTGYSRFTINKDDLTFSISSEDVMIGQNAIIRITVPKLTTGTFKINGDIISIPMSGEIEYIISNPELGEHDITAVYDGNNYNTVFNYTSFTVWEYDSPQWANEGGDTQNTGKAIYASDTNGEIVYAIQINNDVIGGISIDSEGNIYITTSSAIYSFDKNGNPRWNYSTTDVDGGFSGTSIGRDVIVAPKSGDTLYFINQTSGERYGSSNIYQASSLYAPVVDSNANLYIVSEYQYDSSSYKLVRIPYNLWYNGGDPILLDLGSSAPIAPVTFNDDIIVVLMDGRIRVFDANTLNAKFSKSSDYLDVRPVIGEGNIVYVALKDRILAYSISGATVWNSKVSGTVTQMALDSDNGLYYVTSDGLFRCSLSDGKQSQISGLNITSGILIDANSNIYFASDSMFYAMDSNGKVLWKSNLGSNITGSPVMSMDGTIYVTSEDNKVFALTHADLKDPNMKAEFKDNTLTVTLDNQTTGIVSFTINGVKYDEAIVDGKLTRTIPDLKAGSYNVDVIYSGDLRFNASSVMVSFIIKGAPQVNVPASSGNDVTISLPSDATGTVTVQANGKTYTKTLINGKATFTLPDGNYKAVITYSGDNVYDAFTITKEISIKKPITKKASKITAKKKTFKKSLKTKKYTVTLKSGKTPIKKVKLIIKIGKKTFKATTNAKGKATFKIKKLTKKGRYTAKITFKGNKYYKATTKKVKIVLK